MNRQQLTAILLLSLVSILVIPAFAGEQGERGIDWGSYEWNLVSEDTGWEPRAGLQVLHFKNALYLMGGRTPRPPSFPPNPGDSEIWGDVWRSTDLGETWEKILETDEENHWPARAYFEAVTKGGFMYVIGGQNFKVIENPDCPFPYIDCFPFLPDSDFFNDVWRSRDGVNWTQMTADAGFERRAGLSAVVFKGEIYVLGGSQRDDNSIGGQDRIYFNDVWSSSNGADWELLTDNVPWAPRAGARVVAKNGYIYLLGGEEGFFCAPLPCNPPYFNDVWRSRDGIEWELVTEEAEWPARPGHQAVVLKNQIVLFGGFGQSQDFSDPFGAANPMDIWVSNDGADWELVSESPWNAVSPENIKYDFDALVIRGRGQRGGPALFTFGGDRETFDFMDPFNYLNVDSDVWRFAPSGRLGKLPVLSQGAGGDAENGNAIILGAVPNPFNPSTRISFNLSTPKRVTLSIYDLSGRHLRTLVDGEKSGGNHSVLWDGRNGKGDLVASGVYFYHLRAGKQVETQRLVLVR